MLAIATRITSRRVAHFGMRGKPPAAEKEAGQAEFFFL
jgi:hypothetical protein